MSFIGQQIYDLRTDRVPRLTQRELAERAGVSVDLIQKLEQGRKATAKITTLTAIARALDVDLSALLSRRTFLEGVPDDGGLLALRRAITPVLDPAAPGGSVEELSTAVADGWRAYWSGDYKTLAGTLPQVIEGARAADARDQLAEAQQLASCVLVHLGHSDLSLIAVGKALEVVEDPLLRTAIVGTHSWVLLNQGRSDEASVLAVAEADAIEPRRKARAEEVSLWGNLLVTGATAAARDGRSDEARDLLRAAHGAAVRIGEDRNDYQTAFGVSQVVMQGVDVSVVAGDYVKALDTARRMPKRSQLPRAAQARHMTDVAHAHAKLGHFREAENLLTRIEQFAPQWIRYQVFVKAVLAEVLQRGRPTSKTRTLARRLGVG
ncbi:helix-turn-helix domain-containing protein [Micromonospora zhanjiangensis]